MRPAAPQCISGRTSYLRVRLAFHPYPQLIRIFCNRYRFGPSRPITGAAAWPWVAHTVSGLPPATKRALHTRFPSGSGCRCLNQATDGNSSGHTPKGTRSPCIPRDTYGSHCMDAVGFRFYFTPLAGVLFTVPSRYCALSVTSSSQPWTVVGPASHALSRGAWYLSLGSSVTLLGLRDSHPLWCGVPAASEKKGHLCERNVLLSVPARNPLHARRTRLSTYRV